MRRTRGIDVVRVVLVGAWLILSLRMKDHLGLGEFLTAGVLAVFTIAVWFGD